MTKKSFVVILILSIVSTYTATFIEGFLNGGVIAGDSGFPFRFSSSTLFGGSSINYLMLFIDIAFWFVVIWGGWKLLQRFSKK